MHQQYQWISISSSSSVHQHHRTTISASSEGISAHKHQLRWFQVFGTSTTPTTTSTADRGVPRRRRRPRNSHFAILQTCPICLAVLRFLRNELEKGSICKPPFTQRLLCKSLRPRHSLCYSTVPRSIRYIRCKLYSVNRVYHMLMWSYDIGGWFACCKRTSQLHCVVRVLTSCTICVSLKNCMSWVICINCIENMWMTCCTGCIEFCTALYRLNRRILSN